MNNNPYQTPMTKADAPAPIAGQMRRGGAVVLITGLLTLSYGAIAFWLMNWLPPNGGASGRLPSLYVMGLGIVIAVVGLVTRDLRIGSKQPESAGTRSIPTRYGILGLVALMALLILTISRL